MILKIKNSIWPCLRLPTALTVLFLFVFGAILPAQPEETSREFDPKLQQVAVMVARFLQEEHFAKHPIDEEVSREWIQNYMEILDYGHLYFLQSDFEEFMEKHAESIGRKVRYGDISPAFEIYDRFRERFDARVEWVENRLQKPFSFASNDYYITDREDLLWPENQEASDLMWERRLKYELLQNQFAELTEEDGNLPMMNASDFTLENDVLETVAKRHERRAKYVLETDGEDIVESYLSSLTNIYDPHSQYLSQKSYEDFFIAMNQKLFGIGAVLTTEDGYCVIREIIKGGPADLSGGLEVNDRITGVAQGDGPFIDIIDMKLRDAVRLIRGEKGTVVTLEIIPASAKDSSVRRELSIVRDEIKLTHQKAQAKLIKQELKSGETIELGIIQLPSFYGDIGKPKVSLFGVQEKSTSTTDDVRLLLDKLKEKGMDGLILDLRNNGGGLLDEAIRLAGLFIDEGPVVQVKTSKGQQRVFEDEEAGSIYDGPLVVLTNKLSASASEIVAGALQNYARAIVIGDSSTHGKGTVQTVTEVGRFIAPLGTRHPDVGAVKLTIQKFYLPNGASTQKRGVVPDIILPSPNDYLEIGEDTLPHALPWDKIDAAEFQKINQDLSEVIAGLSASSRHRIEANDQFQTLKEDIEKLRERIEDKKVSLNVAQRIEEILDDQTRRKERDNLVETLIEGTPDILSIEFDENLKLYEHTETALEAAEQGPQAQDREAVEETDEEESLIRNYARDLHLKESLNILKDYIMIGKSAKPAVEEPQLVNAES